ncbi:MAG TPA: hypothetical protein VF816_10380 [Rhodocyclaceae bacterium]
MIDYALLPTLVERPGLLVLLLVGNWPVYRELVRALFGGRDGFGEAIRYWFIPDLYSFLVNKYFDDMWAEFRLWLWLALCVGCVITEYVVIANALDWWNEHGCLFCPPHGPATAQ